MSEWQPIETAPKDGRRIMLFYPPNGIVFGRWNEDEWSQRPTPYWSNDTERISGTRYAKRHPPTHWQPLPEPPKVEE